jgi:zinc/manganese transport system permease protein
MTGFAAGIFAPFMMNTWIAATAIAVVAGFVGFFVVLRGASFLAHALPHGAFAGAAGAVLIGVDPLVGMGVFAIAGAVTVSALGRRARADVVIALTLTMMLGLGALFLSLGSEYSSEVFALLFGQILGVSAAELLPVVVLGVISIVAVLVLYRPLVYTSTLPAQASARGIRIDRVALAFALVVAVATTMSVPIVGALLMFSLLVGPPAAARSVTTRPVPAIAVSVLLALVTVWVSIVLAFETEWPVGFFVTAVSAVFYGIGRGWTAVRAE